MCVAAARSFVTAAAAASRLAEPTCQKGQRVILSPAGLMGPLGLGKGHGGRESKGGGGGGGHNYQVSP